MTLRQKPLALFVLLCGIALAAEAGEDLTFVAEHVLEFPMDARFASLPTGFGRVRAGGLGTSFSLAYASGEAGLLEVDGFLAAAGVTWGLGDHWSLGAVAFYDDIDLAGSAGEDELNPLFHPAIPFAHPEQAAFTAGSGQERHWGGGPILMRQADRQGPRKGFWSWGFGVLFDRVEVESYVQGYQLLGGAQAGTTGELDLSATYSYVTPFVELRLDRPLGERWRIQPWSRAGWPLPGQGVAGRITGELPDGTAFDLAGDSEATLGRAPMGDPFVAVGLAIEHAPSHLALDLGSTLYQTLYQPLTHRGMDRAILVQLSWHGGGGAKERAGP